MKNRNTELPPMSGSSSNSSAPTTSRRDFLLLAAAGAVTGGAVLTNSSLFAGQGYADIQPPQKVSAEAGKVEVLEYFWFGCPHCFAFEPSINEWAESKPDYVEFVREAPPLNPNWRPHSETFYAAEQLGVTDKIFEPMFNGIHKENRNLRSRKEISKFVGELGVDAKEFHGAMKSFAVESRIKEAMEKARGAGITGVPTVVINGKYRTGNSLAGGHDGIIRVINELAEKEHAQS